MGKVFSREKYIQERGEKLYQIGRKWVDACDGKPVKNGFCGPYRIFDTWCIDVPDEKKETKKVYTMKDFREKRIAVRVGQKHVKEFLRMCEAEGLRWKSGEKPTEFIPGIFGERLAITMHCKYGNGRLMFDETSIYTEQGMTIVDFEDFAKPPAPARYKISIECDGTTTTARMEVNGKEVKTAQAKLNPKDKFSWRIGAETAFGRLWDNNTKKEPPEGVRYVKRHAKVGEWVKIVAGCDGLGEKYKNGDIRKVIGVGQVFLNGWVLLEGENVMTEPREYVVLEGFKPERHE